MRIIKVEPTLRAIDPDMILPLELHIDSRGQVIAYYKEMGDWDFEDLEDFAVTYGLDDRQVEYLEHQAVMNDEPHLERKAA